MAGNLEILGFFREQDEKYFFTFSVLTTEQMTVRKYWHHSGLQKVSAAVPSLLFCRICWLCFDMAHYAAQHSSLQKLSKD
jgi:hypothetical protein